MELATTVPSHAQSFMESYREYRDRAKVYAAKNPAEGSQHAAQVRLLTLFRPGYGLPTDMAILIVGAWFFPPWGTLFSFSVCTLALIYVWFSMGPHMVVPKLLSYLGAVMGYSVGITTPKRKLAQLAPTPKPHPEIIDIEGPSKDSNK